MKFGKNKYRAKKTLCHQGHFHPSKGEALRCNYLTLLQKAGEITDLKPICGSMTIVKGMRYKPDFTYTEKGVSVVEDFKGVITQRFRDIKRMWPHHGQGVLRVSRLVGKKFIVEKDIQGVEKKVTELGGWPKG